LPGDFKTGMPTWQVVKDSRKVAHARTAPCRRPEGRSARLSGRLTQLDVGPVAAVEHGHSGAGWAQTSIDRDERAAPLFALRV
jgi:hypothetical protein